MGERRQAHRREPIEIELDDGRVFMARPLPWQQRTDLGNEIVGQNADAVNELVRLYTTDAGVPQMELQFKQKITNWLAVLKLAYPDSPVEDFDNLTLEESVQLVLASDEVNDLKLQNLIDPNFQPPTPIGGINSSESGTEPGQKIESSASSSSSDLVGAPSLS